MRDERGLIDELYDVDRKRLVERTDARGLAGFTALKALDSNNDNVINVTDAAFGSLRVWQDADGDGLTDAGELRTLAAAGITSISLASGAPPLGAISGNQIRAQSTVTFTGGVTRAIADVILEGNQTESKWLGSSTVTGTAAALPNLKGFGNLKDLHVAMSDAGASALTTLVTNFKVLPATATWTTLKAAADDIMFSWAGVSGTVPTAMTSGFDRQKLAFLEKFMGYELTPRVGGVPDLANVQELIGTWNRTLDELTVRLAAQGPLKAVFGNLAYDANADVFKAASVNTVSDVFKAVIAKLSTVPATALTQWNTNWGPMTAKLLDIMQRPSATTPGLTPSAGVIVKADYAVASLVHALSTAASPLTLQQLIAGLGYSNTAVGTTGADALTRSPAEGMQVFVGDGGNDTLTGGAGQDVYVFGNNFGVDTIIDREAFGAESGDRIRFATLSASQVTFTRSGNDLVINAGAHGKVTVKDHYLPRSFSWSGSVLSNNTSIEEVQFADGSVKQSGEIAEAVGRGTAANDTMIGTEFSDEFEGLQGNDTLQGGNDGDLYYFSRGHGNDVIQDVMTVPVLNQADAILFKSGILFQDLVLERNAASEDLTIRYTWAGDSITISGQFAYSPYGYQTRYSVDQRIEAFYFVDEGGYGWIDFQKAVLKKYTTDGHDFTYGYGTADEFKWSAGNDFLQGQDGGDVYFFGRGAGQDTIRDAAKYGDTFISDMVGYQFGQTDALVFDAGISAGDLTFSRPSGSNDLIIKINGTTDQITVANQFKGDMLDIFGLLGINWADRVEEFRFADGSKITWQQMLAKMTTGTAGNDVLQGAYFADTFDGMAGNDVMRGYEEGDIYKFGRGCGQDVIEDLNSNPLSTGNDIVQFGAGISVAQIIFTHNPANDDLLISISGTSDTLTIKDQYYVYDTLFGNLTKGRIEQFKWADGTVKTWSDIANAYFNKAKTAGADTIVGTNYGETIDGGAGNDTLQGRNGDDTYVFGRGYGQDVVTDTETDFLLAKTGDRVLFNADTAVADVQVLRGVNESIVLRITPTGDTLTLTDNFKYSYLSHRPNEIETIQFSNGTKWTGADLRLKALASQSTSGADTIRGFYTADTITGGLGNDILKGGDGSDTYIINTGHGNDTIQEQVVELNYADNDVIRFGAGIAAATTTLSRSANNLDLIITTAGMTVSVTNQFLPFGKFGSNNDIESIVFADNTVWTDAFIRQKLVDAQKTTGANTVTGFYGSEIIDGGAGNDTLRGGEGGDTYKFAVGYGADVIQETAGLDRNGPDTIDFGTLTRSSATFTKTAGTDNLVIRLNANDAITVANHFAPASTYAPNRVEAFKFTDGTLSYLDVNAIVFGSVGDTATIQGSSAGETLNGTSADDIIAGRGGNDTTNSWTGNDTFLYAAGDGNDIIDESSALAETDILFLTNLNAQDVTFERRVIAGTTQTFDKNLYIKVNATDQTIQLNKQFDSATNNYGVEYVKFADGSLWNRAKIWDSAIVYGTSAVDTIKVTSLTNFGFFTSYDLGAGADVIESITSNAFGSGGSDRYLWGIGSGNDSIKDLGGTLETDVVVLKDVYQKSDLTFTRFGLNLLVKVNQTNETLTIVDQFKEYMERAPWNGVEQIILADDPSDANPPVVLTRADLLALAPLIATTASLLGGAGDDGLEGRAGLADTLSGLRGSDVYLFGRGSGADTVNDNEGVYSDADRIVFKSSVGPSDVQLSHTGDNLVLKIAGTTDQLTISNHYLSGAYDIESFQFADGTTWSQPDVNALIIKSLSTTGGDTINGFVAPDIISGGAGNDTIFGDSGNDQLDGGTGDDYLRGGLGDDVFFFGRGYGLDRVLENGGSPSKDKVQLGANIATSDVVLGRIGDDLTVGISGTADLLTLQAQYGGTSGQHRIEELVFADGTVWSDEDIMQKLIERSVTAGNDTITGFDGRKDRLDGFAGTDTLTGGTGDDVYVFGRGYGLDTIVDVISSGSLDEIVFLQGIAAADVRLLRSGSDLEIAISGTSDKLVVVGQFSSKEVEKFAFADGMVWGWLDVQNFILAGLSTIGNDTIVGFDGDDAIDGLAGSDMLRGGTGSDVYTFGRGYGARAPNPG